MNEQLVEKVARAMCPMQNPCGHICLRCESHARRAIALVGKECAKVASDQAQVFRDDADANRKFGNNEKYKWGMAIARFFDAHAAAILTLTGEK